MAAYAFIGYLLVEWMRIHIKRPTSFVARCAFAFWLGFWVQQYMQAKMVKYRCLRARCSQGLDVEDE